MSLEWGLFNNNLHRTWQLTGDTIRTNCCDLRDIESTIARKLAESITLTVGEVGTITCHRNSITHIIEEYTLEAQHLERNVKQTIVDGCMYTFGSHQSAFGESTTLVAVGTYSNIRCRIWQFAHLKRECTHLAKFATLGSRDAKYHILAYG